MHNSQQLSNPKIFAAASFRHRLAAAAIVLSVVSFFGIFAVTGRNGVDMGRWLGYCGFRQRTGLPCPTCGMTTATLAFAQGHIGQAFYIQPACGLICSAMVVAALLALVTAVFAVRFRFIDKILTQIRLRYLLIALAIIIAAGWAVTMARALAEATAS